MRFSGAGPGPLVVPATTRVSPETTSFTVPRSQPVAIRNVDQDKQTRVAGANQTCETMEFGSGVVPQ